MNEFFFNNYGISKLLNERLSKLVVRMFTISSSKDRALTLKMTNSITFVLVAI